MSAQSFSHVQLFATLWTVACHTAPLSMGFSRQEYWSELLCPPAEDILDPRIKPVSPVSTALQADSILTQSPGKPHFMQSISSLLARTGKPGMLQSLGLQKVGDN